MPAESVPSQPTSPAPSHPLRVEYLGFRNTAGCREYRLAVYGPDGPAEFRFRIALAAFEAEKLKLQDGPDICYQTLLKTVAAGDTVSPDGVTISDADLALYREAHRKVPNRRSPSASSPPSPPPARPRPPSKPRLPLLPVPEPVADGSGRVLAEGQRVSHESFGLGVVASSSGGRTEVCFDEGGKKRFVTSIVELEILSAANAWETGPKGKNRPREAALTEPQAPPGEGPR
jgi:hypothetical protein